MKIEKVNKNKLKIILSIEELSMKNITIKDIEEGKKKAQNFFFDVIEDSDFADEFLQDDSRLLVEASVSNSNNFIITITKIDSNIHSNIDKLLNNTTINYTISSTLYMFENLCNLEKFTKQAIIQELYVGSNSLYCQGNCYFLLFSKNCIKNTSFRKTFAVLSEYCTKYFSKPLLISSILENSKPIIEKNAINILSKSITES